MRTDVALAGTFLDVEKLLHHCCNEFHRRNPSVEYDDLFGQACLTFVTAYNQYDSKRCDNFANYLCICVMRRLYQHFKSTPSRLKRQHVKAGLPEDKAWSQLLPDTFRDLSDVWNDLSDDAMRVIRLALDTEGKHTRTAANRIRSSLRRLGWKWLRIDEAFQEIREALGA